MIYQNDQYYLQVSVKQNSEPVTDEMCEEMIIKIGNVTKRKSTGELVFSPFLNCWLFPFNYSQSSDTRQGNRMSAQCWFSVSNGNYYDSNVVNLKLNTSIINKSDLGDLNGN